jgi:hypothetical protein
MALKRYKSLQDHKRLSNAVEEAFYLSHAYTEKWKRLSTPKAAASLNFVT